MRVSTVIGSGDGTHLGLTLDGCDSEQQARRFGQTWQVMLDALKEQVEGEPLETCTRREGAPVSSQQGLSSSQCPSETTSTLPSTTEIAVSSSIAYAGPGIFVAHWRALARVLSGQPG